MTEQKQKIEEKEVKEGPKHEIPEYKIQETKDLVKLIDENNTIMFASIKSLPASNFQKIKKSLRDKVDVRVVKKRALTRALDSSKKEGIKKLKDHLKEDIALLVSNEDAFELSRMLGENKSPIKAKAGQEAINDIEVEAGLTEILAGPAVSELGSLGLQVKVTDSKIEIMKPKVIVKAGSIVSENAASVMGKLSITPFDVGFIPLIAFDSKSNKIFTELIIDKEKTLNEIKNIFIKSRALAVSLGYISKDTICLLLAKANSHGNALNKLVEKNTANAETDEKAEVSSEVSEEKKEETEEPEEKKEENIENAQTDNKAVNEDSETGSGKEDTEAPTDTQTNETESKENTQINSEEVKE